MSEDLNELITAELAAYNAYLKEPPSHPSKVKRAQKKWYAALDARNAVVDRMATEQGVSRATVMVEWLTSQVNSKPKKRGVKS